MALDAILAEIPEEPILRIYTWSEPTLSLGRHQKRINLNIDYMKKNQINCVLRPTGGRAVLHWDELTYAVILPANHIYAKSGVLETYLKISQCISKALKSIGYNAEIQPARKIKNNSQACFDAPSSYELCINGKKVVGSAQMRTNKSILQHGSIVLKKHVVEYARCLNLDEEQLEGKMAGLFDFHGISIFELSEALQIEFEKIFGYCRPFPLNSELFEKAFERKGDYVWKVS